MMMMTTTMKNKMMMMMMKKVSGSRGVMTDTTLKGRTENVIL